MKIGPIDLVHYRASLLHCVVPHRSQSAQIVSWGQIDVGVQRMPIVRCRISGHSVSCLLENLEVLAVDEIVITCQEIAGILHFASDLFFHGSMTEQA